MWNPVGPWEISVDDYTRAMSQAGHSWKRNLNKFCVTVSYSMSFLLSSFLIQQIHFFLGFNPFFFFFTTKNLSKGSRVPEKQVPAKQPLFNCLLKWFLALLEDTVIASFQHCLGRGNQLFSCLIPITSHCFQTCRVGAHQVPS